MKGYTQEQNIAEAIDVFFTLIKADIHAFCPHLTALAPQAFTISYEQWLSYDFAIIDLCSHVLMLPRWQTSRGACREKEYAHKIGKHVVFSVTELIELKHHA